MKNLRESIKNYIFEITKKFETIHAQFLPQLFDRRGRQFLQLLSPKIFK